MKRHLYLWNLANTMSAYNFTWGMGEQEGKILANHLSEESSKNTDLCSDVK